MIASKQLTKDIETVALEYLLKNKEVESNELFNFLFIDLKLHDYVWLGLLTKLARQGYISYDYVNNKFIVANEPIIIKDILGLKYKTSAEIIHALCRMSKIILKYGSFSINIDNLKEFLPRKVMSKQTLWNSLQELTDKGYFIRDKNMPRRYRITERFKEFLRSYYS